MKKLLLAAVLFLFLISSCSTIMIAWKAIKDNGLKDIKLPDLPDKNISDLVTNELTSKLGVWGQVFEGEIENLKIKAKENIETSYNVTDFQYAILFGDNSSLFESKENYQNLKGFSYFLFENKASDLIQARNSNTAGEMLYITNHFEVAEKAFLKSLQIYEKIKYLDSTDAVLTMNNLGLLYQTIGKYSLSEKYLNMALSKRKNPEKDTSGYAATLNNLGVLYKIQGNFTEAEQYLKLAESFVKKNNGENNIQYAIILNNQAMVNQMINKTEKAEELMVKSLNIAEKHTKAKSATFVRLNVNLALLYQATKNYTKAEEIYLDAMNIKKRQLGRNHPDYAVLLRNLASLYVEMGKFENVESLLTEASLIYKDNFGKENPLYGKTLFELATFYQIQKKYTDADTLFKQALFIQKNYLEQHNPDLIATYENLAKNYWMLNKPKLALENYKIALDDYIYRVNTYFEAMSDAEKTKFWAEIQPKFITFYNFAAKYQNEIPEISSYVYNYHIQTKALLLNSSRKVKNRILSSENTQLIIKYQELQDMKSYISKLYTLTNEELNERKINLDSLIDVSENLEKELTNLSSDYKLTSEQKKLTYYSISQTLNDIDAVVEIIRVEKYSNLKITDSIFYIALVIKKQQKLPEMTVFEEGNKMETDYISQYHKAIMNGKKMEVFYGYFWEKIEKLTSKQTNIYLSVDGIYNQLNVNTIQYPDGNYLIDKKLVYYLTNSKDVIELKQNLEVKDNVWERTAVLIGFPDYNLGMPEGFSVVSLLPGTKVEVENLNKIMLNNKWTTSLLMQKDATETALKKIDNPYVLHIATHGYFLETSKINDEENRSFGVEPTRALENPLLRSGILLAGADKTMLNFNVDDNKSSDDGILNAYEAMVLNLDKTKLVILSACQTGLGDIKTGEGVYGLQRAFQIAGAQTIITSLWAVSDDGTQDLMTAFYKNWLSSGNEYEAFRKAALEIKTKYKYPYYWGAFVLVGK